MRASSLDQIAARLLASDGNWAVHSVFARAMNLRSERGDLLGIALAPAPNGLATVILSDDCGLAPLTALVDVGSAAFASDGTLTIETIPSSPGPLSRLRERGSLCVTTGILEIAVSEAATWSPAPLERLLGAKCVLARIERAIFVAAGVAPRGGLAPMLEDLRPPPPLRGRGETYLTGSPSRAKRERGLGGGGLTDMNVEYARTGLESTLTGWHSGDLLQFAEGCRQLSGLGPGLTPSGDDFLVGLALGLRTSGGVLPESFGHAIYAATDGRTTDLARERVRHAVDGHADEYADAVLRALVMDADADLSGAVTRMLGYGHTSGADTLVGLLAGVRLGLGG